MNEEEAQRAFWKWARETYPGDMQVMQSHDTAFAAWMACVALLSGAASWQPIETAPKDGTHILAVLACEDDGSFDGIHTIRWHEPWGQWAPTIVPVGFEDTGDMYDNSHPTHWMPPAGTTGGCMSDDERRVDWVIVAAAFYFIAANVGCAVALYYLS